MEITDNIQIYIAFRDKPTKRHLYCRIIEVEKCGKLSELPDACHTTCINCAKTYKSESGLDSHIRHVNSKRHQLQRIARSWLEKSL